MRYVLAIAMLLFSLAGVSSAQSDAKDEAPWQATVTNQIMALRAGDGAAALEYAGANFKKIYRDPNDFYNAVVQSGYEPIVSSRSHSFGDYEMVSEKLVMQVVRFVAHDLGLYEALYQIGNEDGEWRVLGVMLRREPGVGS